jgi:hypothetical protein
MASPFAQVIEITPEMAQNYLSANNNNRPLSKSLAQKYAKQMANGDWYITGQGISLAADGSVLDGQHRLQGVIEHNSPVKMLVMYNCDKESFTVLDTGRSRNATDVLKIAGCDNHTKIISAGLRLVIPLLVNPGKWFASSQGITNKQIRQMWEDNKDLCSWAAATANMNNNRIFSKSVFFTFLYFADSRGWNHEILERFTEDFVECAGLEKGSPILAYRNYIAAYRQQVNMNQQRLAALSSLIKCFNQTMENKHVDVDGFKPPEKGSITPLILPD